MRASNIATLCGAAAIALSASAPAHAQERMFDVSAQSAINAIPEFARQAEIQIVAPANDLEGVQTPEIKGRMDVRAALRRLLAGTPLQVASDDGQVITLRSSGSVRAKRRAESGVVTGQILDPATGEYLRNATIQIETADGRRLTAVSGEGGEYRVVGVPAGAANLTVGYTGYLSQSVPIAVVSGQTVRRDVALLHSASDGADKEGEIVVTAGVLEGDARAIMDQRQSMDIKDNLSVESYGDIADGNPAEFIKYMPGVDTDGMTGSAINVQLRGLPSNMTGVTLDGMGLALADASGGAGDSRTASFEGLSLAGIDSIEISKTVSADVDASSPAGTINIRTKRAFDRRGRSITIQLSGATHANLWDSKNPRLGERGHGEKKFYPNGQVEYSDVFFHRHLGVMASVSQTNTYMERENLESPRDYKPTDISPEPLAIKQEDLLRAPRITSRFAATFNVDLKATDNLVLALRSSYNHNTIWQDSATLTFTTGARSYGVDGDPALNFTTSLPDTTDSFRIRNTSTYKISEGKNLSPSFEYKTNHITFDGNFSYSSSKSHYDPLKKGAVVGFITATEAPGNFSMQRDDVLHQDWDIHQVSGSDWGNPDSFSLSGKPTIRAGNGSVASVKFIGGASNLSWTTNLGSVPVVFKTGFKIRNAIYDYDDTSEGYRYEYVGPLSNEELLRAVQSPSELSFSDTAATVSTITGSDFFYMPSPYKLGQMFLDNPGDWKHVETASQWYDANIANRRHFEEKTTAAYVMGTAELTSNVKFRAGVRWERTDTASRELDPLTPAEVEAAGYTVSASTDRATTIEGMKYQYFTRPATMRKGNYDFFFPSASVKYLPAHNTEIHLGYSRTITRPEVAVLAGVWRVNEEDQIIRAPNPNLKPAISDNLSLRVAQYFEPVGMVAINFYMNKVKGLFQSQELTAEEFGNTDPLYADYTFITTDTVSGDAVNIRGLEFEFNHAMTWLPSPLDGLSIRGSFMYNDPEVPIVRVADKVGTLSLSYKKGPVRLYVNSIWTGDKYRSTTPSWFAERLDVSLSGSYQISRHFEAFFSIRNLLTRPLNVLVPGSLSDSGLVPDHSAIYVNNGTSGKIGVKARF